MAIIVKKIDLIEERSEVVQEILERKPTWIVSWGSTVLFLTLLCVLFLLWFIKYPDVITSKIILVNSTPPISIVSKTAGSVVFFVSDKESVVSYQQLGYIKSTVDFKQAQALKNFITETAFDQDSLLSMDWISNSENFNSLGLLQTSFNEFNEQIRKFQFIAKYRPIIREIKSLEAQLDNYKRLSKAYIEKIETSSRQFYLAEKDFLRNKKLYSEGVISAKDFEDKEKELLVNKSQLENTYIQQRQNAISISEIETSLIKSRNFNENNIHELQASIKDTHKKLLAELANWEERNVLKSPCEGNVSFFQFWSNEQFISQGAEILTVIPKLESEIIGRVESPIFNSGKIKIGQTVNILLDSYPYEEFGAVKGEVKSISLMPKKQVYLLQVSLVKGLVTNFNKKLQFSQEMSGTAEVITEDIRLIERILYQLTKGVRKN
jgi:HlyD family secretion protein